MASPPVMTISSQPDPDAIPAHDAPHENSWYNNNYFDNYRILEQPLHQRRPIRLACVGAGATGLQIAYKAERLLKDVKVTIYEKNADVGGTWLENRYPGCACDIPSHSYQFKWHRNPSWSQFYSGSEEIWRYFKDIAQTYDLEKYIKLNTKVERAVWDEEGGVWRLTLVGPDGTRFEDACEILANASGVLNSWKYPDVPGISDFKGKLMHSASWDSEYDLRGKTVAVLGGGSSAVQIIPQIQPIVGKLIPFLRSPVWVTTGFGAKFAAPGGTNFNYSEEQLEIFNEDPEAYQKYCRELEGELNKRFTLMHIKSRDQKDSRGLVANLMAEQLGHDPLLKEKMIPEFALGCRRMTPGSGYLQSLTKDNVQVVSESIVKFTEKGVVDESGNEHEVDVVICATGFDNSFTPHFEVIGRKEANLKEQFGDAPKAYLSVTVENFPNLFLLLGPNGPISHGSVLPIFEWHTRYMFQMINKLQTEPIKAFEPKPKPVQDYYNHTHELMKRLAWSAPCSSWFKNGKSHGPVTAVYPGSRLHYFEMLKNVRYEDYEITYWGDNAFAFMGNGYTETELDPNGDPVWYFDDEFLKM
ncbi:putative sterigmatocystin biosynthesis monooxygenase [Lachnellula suecica]|uniref:Putative sterigmatocystin biosynthesis monooxygenase n=1 Tax=Lachnellula suecica TaxID=602035 RepID=A0A8T9BXV4_9HELO|nr:putative sterigmatocystin biosynthesis monooxygenase [Lachnellula suecica]